MNKLIFALALTMLVSFFVVCAMPTPLDLSLNEAQAEAAQANKELAFYIATGVCYALVAAITVKAIRKARNNKSSK